MTSTLTLDLSDLGMEPAAEAATAEPSGAAAVLLPHPTFDDLGRISRAMRKRRSVPIAGYVGMSGSGKSLAMVRDTLPSLAAGRRVYSTVPLLDPITREPHPLYVPFTSWEQLHDMRDADLCLDEITGALDSRDGGLPRHVRRLMPQMRRRNVMIRWSGIDWDNSDKRLRQITWAVSRCRGYLPNHALVRATGTRDALAMWAPNRLFSVVTIDAQALTRSEDSRIIVGDDGALQSDSQASKRRPRVLSREYYWGPRSIAFDCYDTLGEVSAVDNSCTHVDPGTGLVCGLRVAEKTCRGHDEGAPMRANRRQGR